MKKAELTLHKLMEDHIWSLGHPSPEGLLEECEICHKTRKAGVALDLLGTYKFYGTGGTSISAPLSTSTPWTTTTITTSGSVSTVPTGATVTWGGSSGSALNTHTSLSTNTGSYFY